MKDASLADATHPVPEPPGTKVLTAERGLQFVSSSETGIPENIKHHHQVAA